MSKHINSHCVTVVNQRNNSKQYIHQLEVMSRRIAKQRKEQEEQKQREKSE